MTTEKLNITKEASQKIETSIKELSFKVYQTALSLFTGVEGGKKIVIQSLAYAYIINDKQVFKTIKILRKGLDQVTNEVDEMELLNQPENDDLNEIELQLKSIAIMTEKNQRNLAEVYSERLSQRKLKKYFDELIRLENLLTQLIFNSPLDKYFKTVAINVGGKIIEKNQ
ncbi:MAG: hypothetical protein ACQERU_09330 [Bacteroidota bacterium]